MSKQVSVYPFNPMYVQISEVPSVQLAMVNLYPKSRVLLANQILSDNLKTHQEPK
jgi:hypothetical protein